MANMWCPAIPAVCVALLFQGTWAAFHCIEAGNGLGAAKHGYGWDSPQRSPPMIPHDPTLAGKTPGFRRLGKASVRRRHALAMRLPCHSPGYSLSVACERRCRSAA
ncbi:hypothetical protein B0T25DRAFT_267722 [Lasiosphaeria hispida]|uniref:Secreted protein n=1 Tax=Lasiosphaeria hispida TaxID=260671 RepID=A0AAJ0HAJ5_9PEZI|nr:hypothetical protein B0T25DRAFT_267722 [Lasiosphaeria hispida]